MYNATKASIFFIAAITLCTAAFASNRAQQHDLAAARAKTSLVQAIEIAQRYAHGKASGVKYEQDKSGAVYNVEVIGNGMERDVSIDVNSGRVVSSTENRID